MTAVAIPGKSHDSLNSHHAKHISDILASAPNTAIAARPTDFADLQILTALSTANPPSASAPATRISTTAAPLTRLLHPNHHLPSHTHPPSSRPHQTQHAAKRTGTPSSLSSSQHRTNIVLASHAPAPPTAAAAARMGTAAPLPRTAVKDARRASANAITLSGATLRGAGWVFRRAMV